MAEPRPTPTIDLEGLSPEEAFGVLGNEIRLEIVRVLWQTGATHRFDDVTDTAETISFSALRRAVDVDDNGRFNYHLSELVPEFVRRTDDGYRLSGAGKRIARTVIAISSDDVDVSATLDQDCPLCAAPMTASYEDQWIRIRCTECDGMFGDETPEGAVFFASYPAAGLADRSSDEALDTGFYRCMLDMASMMRDVCRECGGSISSSVSVCAEHEPTGSEPCPRCGTRFPVWAEQRCGTCGFAKRLPVEAFVLTLAPVIGFLDEEGIDALAPSFAEIVDLLGNRVETTVTDDPFRVSVTIEAEPTDLEVSLDEEMTVVEVDRRRNT